MGVTGAEVTGLLRGDLLRAGLTAKDGQEKVAPEGDGDCPRPTNLLRWVDSVKYE